MALVRNCPFDNEPCDKSDCRLWVDYIYGGNEEADCAWVVLVKAALPAYGAAFVEDKD